MNPAREAAKQLIARYVERGDSIGSLASGYLGAAYPNGMLCISARQRTWMQKLIG